VVCKAHPVLMHGPYSLLRRGQSRDPHRSRGQSRDPHRSRLGASLDVGCVVP
jgi:hypothetical protein